MNRNILFIVNHDVVIYNFRKELIEKLIEEKYSVFICAPYGKKIDKLIRIGCTFINIDVDRHGVNPVKDMLLVKEYVSVIKKINPEVVFTYTVKPNIYGGLATRICKVNCFANITGLGIAVNKKGFLRKILINLYKVSLKNVNTVFFQNDDNKQFFLENKIKLRNYKVISGSGVNIKEFKYQELTHHSNLKVLYVGRLMKDKGIFELLEAARLLTNVEFTLIGFCEKEDECKILGSLGSNIRYLGFQENVKHFIYESDCVILPSYHEGMANVLLEASACGRICLGTNIPGIKEIIDDGVTGYLFPPRNIDKIAECINRLSHLSLDTRIQMGLSARNKVVSQFDRKKIVDIYMCEIRKLEVML